MSRRTSNRTICFAASPSENGVSVAFPVALRDFRGRSGLKPSGILVGVAGFEPATPSSRTRCATRLRYTPPQGRPYNYGDRALQAQEKRSRKSRKAQEKTNDRGACDASARGRQLRRRKRGPLDCRAAGCDDLCRPSGHSATCQESVRSPCLRPWGEVVIRPVIRRSVAQSGSAPRSGRGGRRFKSCHSDQLSPSSNPLRRQLWRQKRVAEATHNDDWRRWPDEDERTGRRLGPPPVILGE